jgi:hypothetical protein
MMSMPMLDRANDLLERADKLDDAGLLGQGAQLGEHVERAGHGLVDAGVLDRVPLALERDMRLGPQRVHDLDLLL